MSWISRNGGILEKGGGMTYDPPYQLCIYSTEEQVVSLTAVLQLQYSYEYGNWDLFKIIPKWASAEMYLRRSSTAFRIATIKNMHRWLLPKCLQKQLLLVEYSQSIQENKCEGVLLKQSYVKSQKSNYFPKFAFCISLPFVSGVSFIFFKYIERSESLWGKIVKN